MDFSEFTDIIKDIFNHWNIEATTESVKLKIPDTESKFFTITKEQFEQLCDRNQINSSDNSLEICRSNYYEVLLQSDSYRYVMDDDCKAYSDNVNKITYRQGIISNDFVFHMLSNRDNIGDLHMLFRYPRMLYIRRLDEVFPDEENSLLEFVSKIVFRRYNSLVIESESNITIDKARTYMYAYVYTYMFNKQVSLFPCFDIKSLFPQRQILKRYGDFDCPKKIYITELISYYNEAISSSIWSHKYLSFYHILEYFYENVFIEDQIVKAREILTDVGFSYKRNKDIANLIKKIQAKAIDKDITINEKTALSLLIQKHITQDVLKEKLVDKYGDDFIELLNNKVEFSGGNVIVFSEANEKQYIDSLTNRIYKTRNAIVHSKESLTDEKKNNKYHLYKDDNELLHEIALIQVVAEIIINETAKDL